MFSNDNWLPLILAIGFVCLIFPPFMGLVLGIFTVLALKFIIFEILKSMS